MPFAIDGNPSQSELSDSINYLLANFGSNFTTDPVTGQITVPGGLVLAYLYRYIAVKYADSIDGSTNFSNVPTNRQYYGVRNTDDPTESTNPADYVWTRVSGGFGTTKFLFYQTNGGRQIQFEIQTASPGNSWLQDAGVSIDLDIITAITGVMVAAPAIYRWTTGSTPPARPSTTSTYTWATGAYTAPAGWATTIPVNTTPGDFLWAIIIPLVESINAITSPLDWTDSAYPIICLGSNGATGQNGLSGTVAYRVQSQSAAAPTFTTPTSGSSIPSGWVATAPTVSVGDVLWYIQGEYNSSSGTINGVPANSTAWTGPIAASIFQDIRSDNWNGSNPPTAGNTSTWGTQGYYISRTTGSAYLNDVYGRGIAIFRGNTTDSSSVISAATFNDTYSSINGITAYSNSNSGLTAAVQVYNASSGTGGNGVRAQTTASGSNAVWGQANIGTSYGVRGDANYVGVYGQGAIGTAGIAVNASGNFGGYFTNAYPGGTGLWLDQGTFLFGSYTISPPPGGTTNFLRADGAWAPAGGGTAGAVNFGTNSGTATESSNTINILGSTSTGIAGAYVGTAGAGSTVTLDVRTTSPSDRRLKENIENCDLGLDFVNNLHPKKYKLISDPAHQTGYGFIADEVATLGVYGSSLVYKEENWKVGDEQGFDTIHYPSYVAVLVKAVQELSDKVKTLEAKLGV
jgi:hypothetical protein